MSNLIYYNFKNKRIESSTFDTCVNYKQGTPAFIVRKRGKFTSIKFDAILENKENSKITDKKVETVVLNY